MNVPCGKHFNCHFVLSPIVKNAFDRKRTKWQLKCLPQGTFIEALPDESFAIQKLMGTEEIATLNEDVKSISYIESLNMEEVFVNRIKGNEKELTVEMTDLLSNLKKEDFDLAKKEIEGSFVFMANKRLVEILLEDKEISKNLRKGLKHKVTITTIKTPKATYCQPKKNVQKPSLNI
jgi:hypothetical protein